MKINDKNKKAVVEAYQKQVREAIENIKANSERLTPARKEYLKVLEDNIKRAPYLLGYLEWPDEKKKKKAG